jgi:DNA-binding NarL/FixJ family response regulator
MLDCCRDTRSLPTVVVPHYRRRVNAISGNSAPTSPEMCHINVALFESTQMACELLSHALESSCDDLKVITTGMSSELQDDSGLEAADVAVISLALKDDPFGGLKLLRRLVRERPKVNCVLLFDEDNRDIYIEAFRSGAVGVCDATNRVPTSASAFAA